MVCLWQTICCFSVACLWQDAWVLFQCGKIVTHLIGWCFSVVCLICGKDNWVLFQCGMFVTNIGQVLFQSARFSFLIFSLNLWNICIAYDLNIFRKKTVEVTHRPKLCLKERHETYLFVWPKTVAQIFNFY